MTIRQQIMDKVLARLSAIRIGAQVTVNGQQKTYATDIGSSAAKSEWRQDSLATGEAAALYVWDPMVPQEEEDASIGYSNQVMTVMVELQTRGKTPAFCRSALQDIFWSVGSDGTWDGLADGTSAGQIPADIRAELAAQKFFGVLAAFEIRYSTEMWEL